MTLKARQAALEATVARFDGRPFAYGQTDCVRLAYFHLRRMGHRPQLGKAGRYASLIGAVRALKRTGFASLPEALDGIGLPRIPPAAALVGDILALPGDGELHALQIVAGNGRVYGFHEDRETACFIQPTLAVASAWRVDPR